MASSASASSASATTVALPSSLNSKTVGWLPTQSPHPMHISSSTFNFLAISFPPMDRAIIRRDFSLFNHFINKENVNRN